MKQRIRSTGGQGRKKHPEKARKRQETQKEQTCGKGAARHHAMKYICKMGIPEGKEEEQGIENLFQKVMMENFPNLMREKVTQI